jgi:hypothetical protein
MFFKPKLNVFCVYVSFFLGGGGGVYFIYNDSTLQNALLYEGVLELGAESFRLQAGKRTGNLQSGSHAC